MLGNSPFIDDKLLTHRDGIVVMVGQVGLEPTTTGL